MKSFRNEQVRKAYEHSPVRSRLLDWYRWQQGMHVTEYGYLPDPIRDMLNTRGVHLTEVEEKAPLPQDAQADAVIWIDDVRNDNGLQLSDDILSMMRGHLKDGGHLILALDNAVGMKQWEGRAEVHTAIPYDSINIYPGGSGGKRLLTYSRDQLTRILKNYFSNICFYYPVPDYLFPTVIYSDEFLPQPGDLKNDGVLLYQDNFEMFHVSVAFNRVCEDGMFPYFANSFLIFAEK